MQEMDSLVLAAGKTYVTKCGIECYQFHKSTVLQQAILGKNGGENNHSSWPPEKLHHEKHGKVYLGFCYLIRDHIAANFTNRLTCRKLSWVEKSLVVAAGKYYITKSMCKCRLAV